jgi:hypothetical protein
VTPSSPCLAARAALHASLGPPPGPEGRAGEARPELRAHLAACPDCAGIAAAYARVDGAIAGLVPPPAPRDLPVSIRAAVSLRRAADARWARAQSLVLVAAAVLVVVGVSVPLGDLVAPSGWPDAVSGALRGTLDEVSAGPGARVGAVLGALGDFAGRGAGAELSTSSPFGPLPDLTLTLLALAVAAPLLVVVNRALSRRHPEVA